MRPSAKVGFVRDVLRRRAVFYAVSTVALVGGVLLLTFANAPQWAVVAYLVTHFKRSRNYDRMYGASWEYQRDGRYGLVPYELFGVRSLILWSGWFPFLFNNQVESKAASGQIAQRVHIVDENGEAWESLVLIARHGADARSPQSGLV